MTPGTFNEALKAIVTLALIIFLLYSPGIESVRAQTAQSGNNFSAGNGMEMVWVAPMNGWVGKYLVTQEQFQKVMGTNPSYYKGPRHPVEMVSWNDAIDYCKKLTEQDHASGILPANCQYTLPTDAQFDLFIGDAGGEDDAAQLKDQQKPNFVADVGSQRPNQFGLYDTRGLFWQWCLDDFNRKSMNNGPETADLTSKYYYLKGGSGKVLRGGAIPHLAYCVPVAFRSSSAPKLHHYINGVRAVVVPAQKSE